MKTLIALGLLCISSISMAHVHSIHNDHHKNKYAHPGNKLVSTGVKYNRHNNEQVEKIIVEVKQLIHQGRQNADENFYRKANDLLNTLPRQTDAAKLYRAEIQQYFHKFDKALVTLKSMRPSTASQLLKASIEFTQGKYADSYQSCKGLFGKVDELLAVTCMTQAMSLNGKLDKAYQILSKTMERNAGTSKISLHWAYTTLAEMSERRMDTQTAMTYYNKALEINDRDVPSRIAYADLLIADGNYEKTREITQAHLQHDLLLLRYVRALNIQGDLTSSEHFCELKRRVLTHSHHNNHLHYDLMAEYYLYFSSDFDQSLEWANKHWEQQKTPRDARLLANVSVISGIEDNLQSVKKWRSESQLEDGLLDRLIKQSVSGVN